MRLFLLLVLGCSGVVSPSIEGMDGDASVDVLVSALSGPASTLPVAPPRLTPPRLVMAVAAESLAKQLEIAGAWMWSATLVPDVPAGPVMLPFPPQYGLARETRLARVTLFQSVGVDVARDGAALSTMAPLIAGRALRVRAYLAGGAGSLVLGRLRWESAGSTTLFVGSMRVGARSDDADPESLFEFEVPEELVTADATFAVDILEDDGESFVGARQARFPMNGDAHALGAEPGMRIDVRLVPMRYGFDGSMRMPDVGDAEVAALRAHIEAAFPVAEASVSVLSARDYDARVGPDDFDEHVDALHQVIAWRANDAPPSAVYYVGLVAPAASFGAYCARGCYAGVAPLNETNSPFQRASVVVWYVASRSGWTALHELGHTQGRSHVGCGAVTSEDPDYPYAAGAIGVWGFDQRSGAFVPPTSHDFMSYCRDEWVSDYTYAAMAERTRILRSAPSLTSHTSIALRAPDTSRRLITTGRRVRWSNVSLPRGVLGEATKLVAVDSRGRRRWVPAERIHYSIDGPSSYAVHVDADIVAFEVEGTRLAVPTTTRRFR